MSQLYKNVWSAVIKFFFRSTSSYSFLYGSQFSSVGQLVICLRQFRSKIAMSFGASNTKIKPFVTEDEAQDLTVQRQEEWERVRKPEDPLGKNY